MFTSFYQDKFLRPIPFTFILIERIAALAEEAHHREHEGEELEISYRDLLARSLNDLGVDSPSEETIQYIATRMEALRVETTKPESTEATDTKKTFSSSYLKWAHTLAPEDICIYASDNDLILARHYYEEEDRDTVLHLCQRRMEEHQEEAILNFEACLFGFGGDYKGGSGGDGDATVIDLRKNPKAGSKLFGKLGIGAAN